MAELDLLKDYIKPTARQMEFISASQKHTYTLYGGAAGGGKSYILRWWCLRRLLYHFSKGRMGVQVGLFCETYRALEDRQIKPAMREFPREWGTWDRKDASFKLAPQFGGGLILFRNLDDPGKYQSVEFADQAFDELTLNEFETWFYVNRRRRWAGVPMSDCKMVGATNPGGIGHQWVKKLWIDKDYTDLQDVDPDDFAFVPAKLTDNPHIDPSYARNFLTEEDKAIYVEGDWNVFAGQYFKFRSNLHVVDPFDIPPSWRRWCGLDYGTYNPFCCLWIAQDSATGRRYVYRERYQRGLSAEEQAQLLWQVLEVEPVQFIAADPSMWHRNDASATSLVQAIAPVDVYRMNGVALKKAANERISGWNQVRQALALMPDGKPGLQIFSTCRNLIRTLPTLIHDEDKPEDTEQGTGVEDHAADALRYALHVPVIVRAEPKKKRNPYSGAA